MDREKTEEFVQQKRQQRKPLAQIKNVDKNMISIDDCLYRIVLDHYQTFDIKAFRYRYVPFYDRFDFILGDWSYSQLRLTGFYNGRRNVPNPLKVDYLHDYLMEYCNFGSPYFLLQKLTNGKRK